MDDQELGLTLGRIEQKQDGHKEEIKLLRNDMNKGFESINGNVGALAVRQDKTESWIDRVKGGAKTVSIICVGLGVIAGLVRAFM